MHGGKDYKASKITHEELIKKLYKKVHKDWSCKYVISERHHKSIYKSAKKNFEPKNTKIDSGLASRADLTKLKELFKSHNKKFNFDHSEFSFNNDYKLYRKLYPTKKFASIKENTKKDTSNDKDTITKKKSLNNKFIIDSIKCVKGTCQSGISSASDKKNRKTWVGKFENGQILDGIMQILPNVKYEGKFKNFKPDGYGELTMGNQDFFYTKQKGLFKNGMFVKGNSKVMVKDAFEYEGEMVGVLMSGSGKMIFSNGDVYIGGFKRGKLHGQGSYTWLNESNWVGNFSNGQRNGSGIFTSSNGSKTISNWSNGKFIRKVLNPYDLSNSSNLFEIGLKILGNNYSYKNNKPILFYDPISKSMRECSGSIIGGSCTNFKSPTLNSYNHDTLYYNPETNSMQQCNNAVLGKCYSFLPKTGIISKDQLFYNPRTRSMTTCLNANNQGKCYVYGVPPMNLNKSSQIDTGTYLVDSKSNPYFKKVPEADDLLELGLNMLSGGCTLGVNC